MDSLERDLEQAHALYAKLAEQLVPGRAGVGGRRPVPASRPPVRADVLSTMFDLERFMSSWVVEARLALGER